MKNILLYLFALAGGVALPIQAALNGKIGKAVDSPIWAGMFSFFIGTIALLIYGLVTGEKITKLKGVFDVPLYAWAGGLFGGFYVTAIIILFPRLGAALAFGLVVAGQLIFSLVLEHFGWFGLEKHSISFSRLLGLAFIIGGVLMFKK